MVWLHGGGLWRLSAAGDWQSGHNFSPRGDVVMVSPNHRIGVLGFAHFEDINPDYPGSSHVGMLDLVQVLIWVRENIEEFGGDPDNVTIFGQSGGGQKVSLLLAMPEAQGLFHKAVIQSGPAPLSLERPYANELATSLLDNMAVKYDDTKAIETADLNQILTSYYEIFDEIGGYGVMGVIQDFAPVVDGVHLPQQPFWHKAPEFSRHIPLIIGSTRTEMTEYTLAEHPDAASMDFTGAVEMLKPIFAEDTEMLVNHYRQDHPDASAWEVFSLIKSDWPTRLYSLLIADLKADQKGAPVYVYRMEWETEDRGGVLMSPHAIDIQFVLDTAHATPPVDLQVAERAKMTGYMLSAWTSFAKTGAPVVNKGPTWPQYNSATKPTFHFNLQCGVSEYPDADDMEFLKKNMDKYRVVAGGVAEA